MIYYKPSEKKKKFSIILPSLRKELLKMAVESIYAYSYDVNYEIVVVSPFPVSGKNIVHVLESEPKGNCTAHALGYQAATGDIIVAMSDDHLASYGWLTYVESFLEEKEKVYHPFLAGIHRPWMPIFGTVYGLYYPYFPAMSRKCAEAIGGYFSTAFKAHFGDPDIGMRVWKAGGRCELMYEANILINDAAEKFEESPHKHTTLDTDFQTFVSLYHEEFGAGFEIKFRNVNVDYFVEHLRERTFKARIPKPLYYEREYSARSNFGPLLEGI